ncbi:50S ribosomal protein L3 [bacterium]|nr:50S ribosomal protein L3 [bacterium]
MLGIIGKKVGMTSIYTKDGLSLPVTVIKAGPCEVVQVKTKDTDGYKAIQLGFEVNTKKVTKPLLGHFKKANLKPYRKLREFRLRQQEPEFKQGDTVSVDIFKEREKVNCTGISKGKGFTGAIRRYGFHGGPKTHGQSNKYRAPGSIGTSATPSRVVKGKKMAGHVGSVKRTVKKLEIIKIDTENSLILVKGSVPGYNGSYVIINKL